MKNELRDQKKNKELLGNKHWNENSIVRLNSRLGIVEYNISKLEDRFEKITQYSIQRRDTESEREIGLKSFYIYLIGSKRTEQNGEEAVSEKKWLTIFSIKKKT